MLSPDSEPKFPKLSPHEDGSPNFGGSSRSKAVEYFGRRAVEVNERIRARAAKLALSKSQEPQSEPDL